MNRYAVILISAAVMVGCLKTRGELAAEEANQTQEHQTVVQQKAQTVAQNSSPTVVYKEKPAAAAASRVEEVDEQLRTLSGRIDANENAISQIKASKENDKQFGAQSKASEDAKFQAYEDALKKLEAQVQALSDQVTQLKTAPPPQAEVPPPVDKKSKGKVLYDSAEEQFGGKKWKEAIVNYQKYRDQNPKGKLYADATYKIGVCFQEIGMKDEARSFLEEVTAKYPNSKEAKKAAFRLKSLK